MPHTIHSACRAAVLTLFMLPVLSCASVTAVSDAGGIRPYEGNPFYWQFKGKPILLLGASDYHNIFQRTDLVEHLDLMQSVGGNYVRNTMASREIKPGHNDRWPYRIVRRTDDPRINVYDLNQWDEEYWRRFSRMLEETAARDIIVEVELWERHDCYRTRDQAGWLRHPYNPDNNVNFTAEESGLPTGEWTTDPGHPLFATVPRLQNNTLVLRYQEAFIDKVLSYTLRYDHVLYNMNNETKEHHYFGEYWADYILAKARAAGKRIELTDMQDAHDVTDASVTRVMDSDVYTFVDISQNNLQKQQTHWERIEHIRNHLGSRPRPITNIKVYGSDNAPPQIEFWGNTRDGVERFWRNIFGGCSSARFHRPDWGIGLNEVAQANVKSMRMLTDAMHVFTCEPRNDLLSERSPNEAYCLAEPGRQYAVYFPDGGSVQLDVSEAKGPLQVRWLDIDRSVWQTPQTVRAGEILELTTPGQGHWAALVDCGTLPAWTGHHTDRIQPYSENPFYWQYKGRPLLLLGGSWQDNLFNHPVGLAAHLDLLVQSGGNYVRNTMSHRNVGNVFAYAQREDGKFDLDRFNEEYWRRFDDFLHMTHERDIIVQIEVWDPWDYFADHQSQGGWSKNPFNPANNVTYTAEESGLSDAIDYNPARTPSQHAFWRTVPALQNNERVLRYQRAFVDKLLSIALQYPHVLYCVHNESGEELTFSAFWADHIHRRAREAGRTVFVTDMRYDINIVQPDHHVIYDDPQRYTFLDISQNNQQSDQTHYDRILHVRDHIRAKPRPLNNTKIYNLRGGDEESVARMFRILFAGGASARFHRPHPLEDTSAREQSSHYGLGLSPRGRAALRSARMLTEALNVFTCDPRNDLLDDRSPNEAFCLAAPGRQYALYFPDGGSVQLDVSEAKGPLQVRWLDIDRSTWQESQTADGGGTLELRTPGKGHWAVVVLASADDTIM